MNKYSMACNRRTDRRTDECDDGSAALPPLMFGVLDRRRRRFSPAPFRQGL